MAQQGRGHPPVLMAGHAAGNSWSGREAQRWAPTNHQWMGGVSCRATPQCCANGWLLKQQFSPPVSQTALVVPTPRVGGLAPRFPGCHWAKHPSHR
ncbi:hypothetical protein V2G26_016261 [Clonostachys chloroleuca]